MDESFKSGIVHASEEAGMESRGSCESPIAHALEITHEQTRNVGTG
jgi:hypothetical protein